MEKNQQKMLFRSLMVSLRVDSLYIIDNHIFPSCQFENGIYNQISGYVLNGTTIIAEIAKDSDKDKR